MCGYRRQEKHPYLLTLAKAPKGKKEGRSGEDGKGERIPWTQRLREDKRHRAERGGDYRVGPTAVQREAATTWIEPRSRVHY